MITAKDKVYTITTANTSYIMNVPDDKNVANLHYGKRTTSTHGANAEGLVPASDTMADPGTVKALAEKYLNPYGNEISGSGNITYNNICLEFSNAGTGDFRSLPLAIKREDGLTSTRFEYKVCYLYEGLYKGNDGTGMPCARDTSESTGAAKPWTLELIYENATDERRAETAGESTKGKKSLKPGRGALELRLIYTAFEDCDVITRRMAIHNDTSFTYTIEDMASMMLDLQGTDYVLKTFDGAWTRERHAHDKVLESGIYETGSTLGISSSMHNPFIMLADIDATEDHGDCYAFNLIYSGNHRERVEVTEYGKTRIMTGIHPQGFEHKLAPGSSFHTPEAVMTYSDKGYNGASHNMHRFITDHIIPDNFRNSARPILINNWEATYFDFNRRKLLNLAKEAAKLGMELFVLDDGWFGERNDDTTSLGDWFVNEKKLGGTLKSLVDEIRSLGLRFGIWVEPEMISIKSKLYEAHPDWVVSVPGMEAYIGRNQYILDYTIPAVRDHIVTVLSDLLESADISYVKWDMNRPLTDLFSKGDTLPGDFAHEYVLGLYDVMKRLTEKFPKVLFEGCSSGGGRFDLGILSYMPQIWTSDDTDPNERMMIQGGTSYGYPPSTMGAHVSASPNHQTLRETTIETRFDVAAMGVLGYELDLTRLSPKERAQIAKQVEFYKAHRLLFQTGEFTRVYDRHGRVIWQIADETKSHGVLLMYRQYSVPNKSDDILYAKDLIPDARYKVKVKATEIPVKTFGNLINMVSPVHIKEGGVAQALIDKVYNMSGESEEYELTGAALMHAGIRLNSRFMGTGLSDGTRVMGDHCARLYTIDRIDK